MIEFKQKQHDIRETTLIEVWVNGKLKAAIYPNDTETGIRVISRHIQGDPSLSFTEVQGIQSWEFKLESV